ncbi:TfoX/Sxy family DNA transformation protein [Bdellovibrio sp. NC01]|uniref:TfoX/Sxy family DNA transformation protein n=1 Tax=Bdellovibrio sp. NC01 TaxID=2220073 RepID=UPI0011579973|nr:TfoX/Sxy family DNA transformation protein [Bdellovibrio sp. NC01]QDK37243.1 hypothetical protein DOE51_06380 [Bdellovibrio sp. NC01]
MAKEPQQLKWVESLLPEEQYRRKAMFGGFAYYIGEKIVLLIFESPGSRSYQGQQYEFELWDGCMFPVERELQDKALARFPFLVSHPILPKWLYIPVDTEGFDELVTEVVEQATRPNSYWGSIPKARGKKTSAGTSKKSVAVNEKIDTRTPRMFSDEPASVALNRAQKISDLKNLGPVAELEFIKAGIKTAPKFIDMGWQKAMVKLVKVNPKNRHSIFAYALIGALQNKEWNLISEDDKLAARQFVKSLAPDKKAGAKKKTLKKAAKKKVVARKKTQKKK